MLYRIHISTKSFCSLFKLTILSETYFDTISIATGFPENYHYIWRYRFSQFYRLAKQRISDSNEIDVMTLIEC